MREPASGSPSDLVVHVPHASLVIPDDLRGQFVLSDAELEDDARTSADLHTDALASTAWPGAMIIAAPVSRLVIDMERFSEDAAEPMAAVGRGMVYDRTSDGKPLRRCPSVREREALKARYYDPHWMSLRSAARGKVLIDLHSNPIRPWPLEPVQAAERPQIDLGVVDGLTPSWWVQAAQEHFQ